MNINKNISVWRGDNPPPTDYHLWIKSDGTSFIKTNNQYKVYYNPSIGDVINISALTNNLYVLESDVFRWLANEGVKDYYLNLHNGVRVLFREFFSGKWKEYIYTGLNEDYSNINNWKLYNQVGKINSIEENIQDTNNELNSLKIIKIPPSNNSILASYKLTSNKTSTRGTIIEIPKDTSIKDVQIKDTNATIDSDGNILDGNPKGNTALCIVYILNTGEYKLVKLDYQSFLEEKEISDGLEVNNNLLKVKIDSKSEKFISVSSNGLKINGIQNTVSRVDSIWNGNPQLVTPQLSGNWTVYKQDNSVVTPTPSFPLEYGYKAKFSGTWKWVETSGKKPPESTTGAWGTSIPESNVNSQQFTSPNYVTSNTTYSQTIYAPKKGLMVSGQDVVPAKGNDSKSISTSISFSNRIYYGASNSKIPTESIIKSLNSKLGGRSNTINGILTNSNQYYYYAYPKSLGNLSTIIQDGATPILGAFTLNTSLIITNNAGLQIPMNVYVSNNPGAFTNNNIKFE